MGDTTKVVAVDIPSGWAVDVGTEAVAGANGDIEVDNPNAPTRNAYQPHALVSLTTPKLGVLEYRGRHYVGGRFLPPGVAAKYACARPPYKGDEQVVRIDDNYKHDDF